METFSRLSAGISSPSVGLADADLIGPRSLISLSYHWRNGEEMISYCIPTISSRTILPQTAQPEQSAFPCIYQVRLLSSSSSNHNRSINAASRHGRQKTCGWHPTLTSPILCYPISGEHTHRTPPIFDSFPHGPDLNSPMSLIRPPACDRAH